MLANNIRVIVDNPPLFCDGDLTGEGFARLEYMVPNFFAGQFDTQAGFAGGDVVHINFADNYGPPYKPVAAFIDAFVGIWDDVEVFQSCGEAPVCFVRLGIDEAIINTDNFEGPPPTTGPTATPTATPPTTPPTATPTTPPTDQPRRKKSSSCAIAGNPVQLGTAMANVLIPLVPIAFVFGVSVIRRRKK
jgi:hypothetical protein